MTSSRSVQFVVGHAFLKACCCLVFFLLINSLQRNAWALQPALINGVIYDTYSRAAVSGASITASTGLSTVATDGRFSLRVPPDVYDIVVSCRGYCSNLLYNILAAPGQTTTVNIWLNPASTKTGFIEGRIGKLYSDESISNAVIATDLGGVGFSGKGGVFRIMSPSGSATVTIAAEGYESKTISEFQVPPGRAAYLIDYLQRARSSSFPISGIMTDACTGSKIASGSVISFSGDLAIATDGFFSLSIPYGFTTLIASADEHQFASRNLSFLAVPQLTSLNLALVPSKRGSGLFTGTITDALTGSPVDNARIQSSTGSVSFSQPDGGYRLYTSQCTSYLDISRNGYATLQVPASLVSGTTTTLNGILTPLARVSGTVYDASDNHTIPGAALFVSGHPDVSTVSRTDGTYLLSNVQPGESIINVAQKCYRPQGNIIETVSGERLLLDFFLTPYAIGTVQGSVTDKMTRGPISGAAIRTDSGSETRTDFQGHFKLAAPACETVLTVSAGGYAPQRDLPLDVIADKTTEIAVELVPCPFFVALENSAADAFLIESLRSYRDMVSVDSALANEYILRFYRHAPEISLVLSSDASLRQAAGSLIRSVAELTLDQPPDHTAVDCLVDDLLSFCGSFSRASLSPQLRYDLDRFVSVIDNGTLVYSLTKRVR